MWLLLSGAFGAEDALEAWPNKPDPYQLFTLRRCVDDVLYDSALRFEIGCPAAGGAVRKGDAYFQVGADGDIEPRNERPTAAAKIFAGSDFFDGDAALIAAT